jgi:hypothetical protein
MMYAESNVDTLKARLGAPLVAHMPYTRMPDAAALAHHVDSIGIA